MGITGEQFKQKARRTYESAEFLEGRKDFEGAANRAYYSVYQALMAKFEELGKRPDQYVDLRGEPYTRMRHDLAQTFAKEVLAAQHVLTVSDAEDLRVQADYRVDPIIEQEFYRVFVVVPDILDSWGVPP